LDFDKKYLDFSRSQATNQASLSKDISEKIQENFKRIYKDIFKGAIVRCDFFEKEGCIYLNEINPVPGSLANYLFDDFNEIVEKISQNLPNNRKISVDYKYINSINAAKGK
jgi:D-alanine-D-alanine ligase